MTQMPSPDSSTTPREAHVRRPSGKSARLRSVLLVSVVSSVVALALGVIGAIGLWYRAQPTADSTDNNQSSLHTLAGRAFSGARDLGAFMQDSASRDLSRAIGLLHSGEEDEENEGDEEGALAEWNGQPSNGSPPAPAAGRTQARDSVTGSVSGRPRSPSQAGERTLTTDTAPPAGVPAPIDPTLGSMFDSRDTDVTPPRMHQIRLRSESPPGPASQAASGETGLVEVVVSATGTVESAKFVSAPLNVHESMLLSAVKAWRFRPAMRDGQAIRFRLTLPIRRARI